MVKSQKVFGDLTGGETPVPIPNTAVKPTRADGIRLKPERVGRCQISKEPPVETREAFLFSPMRE